MDLSPCPTLVTVPGDSGSRVVALIMFVGYTNGMKWEVD